MNWSALASAFGLIFLAELGDKTQLAVISRTCECRRPWPVFLGASSALAAVTGIGVVGGEALARLIPTSALNAAAAGLFIVMGLWAARGAVLNWKNSDADCVDAGDGCSDPGGWWAWRDFAGTFGLLFLAELGDKTQLAVLTLATRTQAPWAVFAGGALALTVVTGLGVLGGERLSRVLPRRVLLALSAVVFILAGLWTAVEGL